MWSRWDQARWWAADYLWAALAWAATLTAPEDPDFYAHGSKPPVVVLPGVFENWRYLRPVMQTLHTAGHPVYAVPRLAYNTASVASGAALVLGFLAERDLRDVVLVAHSKGGLIGKLAMLRDTDRRITKMVSLCTPYAGSQRRRLLPLPLLQELDPEDPLIAGLNAGDAVNAQITSLGALFDEHVPAGSHLRGARNLLVPVAGHFRVLGHPAALAVVVTEAGMTTTDPNAYSSVTA